LGASFFSLETFTGAPPAVAPPTNDKKQCIKTWTDTHFLTNAAKSSFLYNLDREAKRARKSLMQISDLTWLIPAHNATTSRGVPGHFTSRICNFLQHELLLAVKTAFSGAGHLVSALTNHGMILQDGTKHNN
jgi:hypothetical protein